MGRIQSSIGLITGLPIQDTVDQLMKVEARPRDLLVSRTKNLQAQQTAVTELTAKVLGVQFAAAKLNQSSVFAKKTASSSASNLLSATVTGQPKAGQYQFTPVQTAQTHQLLSTGFASKTEPIGAGTVSFRFGRVVDEGVALAELNGGQGVERGKIRITDRSGAGAVVDLRFAQTIDDVIAAINAADGVNVSAEVSGDRILLKDETGQTTSNFRVQEVSGGRTAADLGLANINVADDEALGADVLRLHNALSLDTLNDGAGVDLSDTLADLDVSLRDGTTLSIDFHTDDRKESTLGDLLQTINEADPARLKAELSAEGDRIVLTDLSADTGGTFAVTSPFGDAAEQLGLTGTAVGGVITSDRLLGGLKTSLLSSLNGGRGLELGLLNVTDRAGASATVDLSAAETLEDVIAAINAAGVGVAARINQARNGLVLIDESGGTGKLTIADGDATETAQKLKLAVDDDVASVNSGSLDLQVVARNTRLASLNGGRGVAIGSLLIFNSQGAAKTFNLKSAGVETIGELLDLVNESSFGVQARINNTGDGIALIDTLGGDKTLKVQEVGAGTTARDLHLLKTATTGEENGQPAQVLDGSTTTTITLDEDDTLEDLVAKINDADGGVAASLFSSGSGAQPHRLSLLSEAEGLAGRLVVDARGAGFDFNEAAAARDALLVFGSSDNGAGVLVSSSQNTFNGLIEGLSLTVKGSSSDPVTIDVAATDSDVVGAVKVFVEQYNALVKKLDELTFFNEVDQTKGVLFGTNEALRVESELSSLVTGRFFGVGTIQSLAEVGVNVKDDGSLEFDEAELKARFAADPQAVEEFFATEDRGAADKIHSLIETLAGKNSSLLVDRAAALSRKVEVNQGRILFMSERLEREREQLLKRFYDMELAIGKQQDNLNAIAALQPLPPLVSARQ